MIQHPRLPKSSLLLLLKVPRIRKPHSPGQTETLASGFLGCTSTSHPLMASDSQTHPRMPGTWAFSVLSLVLVPVCLLTTKPGFENSRKSSWRPPSLRIEGSTPLCWVRGHISHTNKEKLPGFQRGSWFLRLPSLVNWCVESIIWRIYFQLSSIKWKACCCCCCRFSCVRLCATP